MPGERERCRIAEISRTVSADIFFFIRSLRRCLSFHPVDWCIRGIEMQSETSGMRPASPATTAQARSELQEYLEVSHQQHGLFPRAALVGVGAGVVAVFFVAYLPELMHCGTCSLPGGRRLRSGAGYFRCFSAPLVRRWRLHWYAAMPLKLVVAVSLTLRLCCTVFRSCLVSCPVLQAGGWRAGHGRRFRVWA